MASLKVEKSVGTSFFGQVKKEPVKVSTDGASKPGGSKPSASKKGAPKSQEPKKKERRQIISEELRERKSDAEYEQKLANMMMEVLKSYLVCLSYGVFGVKFRRRKKVM